MNETTPTLGGVALVLFGVVAVVALPMWGCPKYKVYEQGMAGEAELKRAEQNRQIAVNEAEAKRDAAKMLAEAEIERAKGVAEANKIIGESLRNNESYLRYLWVQGLQEESNAVIYVPTEAGLPILEAGKRSDQTSTANAAVDDLFD